MARDSRVTHHRGARATPPGGTAPGLRFFERFTSISLVVSDSMLDEKRGFRAGSSRTIVHPTGVVELSASDLDGEESWEGSEDGEEGNWATVPGGALDARACRDYMEEAAAAAEREAGSGGGGSHGDDQHARATALIQLYRQEVVVERGTGSAWEEPVRDVRVGARLELRVRDAAGHEARRRLAGASFASILSRCPASAFGRMAGEALRENRGRMFRPRGETVAVLKAEACRVFLHEIGHLLEGGPETPGAGMRIGERVAGDAITIEDDAGRSDARGSYAYDDAGLPAARALLIDAGVVAGHLGPGHLRRASYKDAPLPRMSRTLLRSGEEPPEEILAATPEGLYIAALSGASVDPDTGRVLLVVEEGWRIEAGQRTAPLPACLLVGEARAMLAAIDRIGSDGGDDGGAGDCLKGGQPIPVAAEAPTVRIGALRAIVP